MAEDLVVVKKSEFEKIANAARAASGSEDKYSISELADAVANSIVPPPVESNEYLVAKDDGKVKWESLPFYETVEEVEKIPETTIAAGTKQWFYLSLLGINDKDFIPSPDLDYVVYFDGVEYGPFKTQVFDLSDLGVIRALNLGDTTNLPFDVFGAGYCGIKDEIVNVEHLIRVTEQKVTVNKKLSKNFLPDDLNLSWEKIQWKPPLARYGGADGIEDGKRGLQYQGSESQHCTASGNFSFAVNHNTTASASNASAFGDFTVAQKPDSFAEGDHTDTGHYIAHVSGRYNKVLPSLDSSSSDSWLYVIGNGTSSRRSNAYALDWSGNAWYSGVVEATSFILESSTPNSTKHFKITVDDNGTLTTTEVDTMEK